MTGERLVRIEKVTINNDVVKIAQSYDLPLINGLHPTAFGAIGVTIGGERKIDGATKIILHGGSIVFKREIKRLPRKKKVRKKELPRRVVYLPSDVRKTVCHDISPFERLRFRQIVGRVG